MALARSTPRASLGESFCVVVRGGRELAVPVSAAREVLSGQLVMPAFDTPAHVVGRVDLRGESLPVVSLDAWLNLPAAEYEPTEQILLIQSGEYRAGLVVDRVRDVRRIAANEIQRDLSGYGAGPFFLGCWESEGRQVAVLDAARCVSEVRGALPEWKPVPQLETEVRRRQRGEDYCIFNRGHRTLAMPVSVAREVLTGETIITVPQAPAHVVGVLNLRGEVLPLVQIDSWLGLELRPYGIADQILVAVTKDVVVGIVVDRVRDVRNIEAQEIVADPAAAGMPFSGRVNTLDGEISIVDAQRLVEEVIVLAETGFQGALSGVALISGGPVPGPDKSQYL